MPEFQQEKEQNHLDSEPQQAHQLTQEKQTQTEPQDSYNSQLHEEQQIPVAVAETEKGSDFGVTDQAETAGFNLMRMP